MAKVNNLKKTERQKKQERKTLEGVLVNSHKDKLDNIEISSDYKEETASAKKETESSFSVKKALLPIALGTVAIFGGMGLVSAVASKSAKKIMTSKPQECLPDLALNMNIKQEPQFAMYRMLRDPSTKNIIGFGAVILFSTMTAVLKSFTDGVKKVWIKNQEADIQRDLQENLISVETDSFSGKLDVIREKTNSVSKYLKNVINKKDEENKSVAILLDKNIKPPFKGKEKTDKNNKKKNGLIYGLVGVGVLAFGILMGKITFKNLKNITKTANDFTNDYAQRTANAIDELIKNGDKKNIEQIKNLLESIHASDDYISDTLKKLGYEKSEISKITEEIRTNANSIFSDAPTALGGIPKKIQYYCYLDEDRGHLYNWIINPDNKFTKYLFMAFSSLSAMGYLGKEVLDASQKVLVEKEYSNTELNLAKRLVEVEIANFKSKKDSAINPLIKDFNRAKANGATKEELEEMAENILFEIKNGPPYVYS